MSKNAHIISCGQDGMSLVEVLVAIVLFAIGSLMAVTMTTSSLKANSNSHAIDEGANLGRIKMERLLSLGYEDADLQDTNADGVAGLLAADAASADYSNPDGRYRVSWNIANNEPVNGAKTLSVVVSWPGSPRKQVVFQTIKTE
jgi:type IV pilus assembly protein PilV